MAFLLELKESFKKFYNRYNTYVVPASKFIIALICFIMINTSIGYMDKLKNPVFALLLSVICAFLPGGFTLIVLSAFILIQLYVIAPEFALLVLCVMLLMYLLYFRFAPKTAYILIITAMFCWMKIPFVLPVAIGLCSSVAAVIPVSFGLSVYFRNWTISKIRSYWCSTGNCDRTLHRSIYHYYLGTFPQGEKQVSGRCVHRIWNAKRGIESNYYQRLPTYVQRGFMGSRYDNRYPVLFHSRIGSCGRS